jgi:hypothetical protein
MERQKHENENKIKEKNNEIHELVSKTEKLQN